MEIISEWINDQLRRLFQSEGFDFFREYLGYIIILIALIIVAYILYRSKLSGVIYRSKDSNLFRYKETHEDITKIDPDELINKAVSEKNYRLAIRYCYLKILKTLSDKKLIEWKINKTNYEYVSELNESGTKKAFSDLTYIFEYTWYGELPVEEKLFNDLLPVFNNFNVSLPEKV